MDGYEHRYPYRIGRKQNRFYARKRSCGPSGYTGGPGGDIQATSITTLNPLPGYVGFLTYAGGSTPSATCSAFVNKGAIAINATPVAYQCSNATGSYAWNALNNPYTGLSALVSATTISSASFITTGLVMPSVPASTTAKGHCYLTWEQATAAATVSFGAGMSHAPTDLFITSNINDAATGASNVAYNTQTATSATIIGAATTPGVLERPTMPTSTSCSRRPQATPSYLRSTV